MKLLFLLSTITLFSVGLSAQKLTTIAGTGNTGLNNGPALQASFRGPEQVAQDSEGNLLYL